VVQSAEPGQRLQVAVRWRQPSSAGHRIFINANDEAQASELDELL
jgi:hypothetical protein